LQTLDAYMHEIKFLCVRYEEVDMIKFEKLMIFFNISIFNVAFELNIFILYAKHD